MKKIDKMFKFILDKRNKPLILVIILTFLYFLFIQKIDNLIAEFFAPILSECRSDLKNDILFCTILILIPLYITWLINNKRTKISLNSLFISLILLFIYIIHRIGLSEQTWSFTQFSFMDEIKYADVVIIAIITSVLEFSKKPNSGPNTKKKYFIEDSYETFGNSDLLKRERFASEIVEFLKGTTSRNSFAIGILGNWGSGKTVFLNQIFDQLDREYIKIRFNPWRSNETKLILADFFSSLTKELMLYDPILSKQINSYAKALITSETFSLFRILKPFYHLFYPEKSLQEQYEDITDSIKILKSKIIILIDDLDRLDKKEILEVLRIIRNAVDFPNTFFLVAYEQTYILKSIKNNKIAEANLYLEKIFQLEVTLPSYPEILIRNALENLLKANRPIDEYKELEIAIRNISNAFEETEIGTNRFNIIQDHLHNLRDVIRLVNSFNLTYNNKKGEVDLIDYLIIEIIRLKYYKVHKSISRQFTKECFNNFLEAEGTFTDKKKSIKFNADKFRKYWNGDSELNKDFDINSVSRSLEYLFNRPRPIPNLRAIIFPENGIIYFSSDLFDKISFKEFQDARKNSSTHFLNRIDQWIQEEKSSELIRIFIETHHYSDRSDLENMIQGMMYLNKLNLQNWKTEIYSKIKNFAHLVENYYDGDNNLYKSFLTHLFENAPYPFQLESSLAFDFLYPLLNKEPGIDQFFTEKELKNILLNYLKSYCQSESSKEVNDYLFILFYNCIDSINQNDRHIRLMPNACRMFRDFVERNPENYIRTLIRPFFTPHDGKTFTLEPFIPQTFESYENFEIFLKSQKNTFMVLELKTFYHRYKNNNYKAIEFKRDTIEFYSGIDCQFIGSTKYPELKTQKNVVVFTHPYDDKIFEIKKYHDFKFANWIAHQYPIDDKEANEGGDYLLRHEFSIDEPVDGVKALIHLFVDDFCELEINGNHKAEKIDTGNLNRIPVDEIKCFSTDFPIVFGKNIIDFKIINKSSTEIEYDPNTKIKGVDNPYGIIFIVQVSKIKNQLNQSKRK